MSKNLIIIIQNSIFLLMVFLSFFTVSVYGWSVQYNITLPQQQQGNGIGYAIAFDGGSHYLGNAFGFSPIVKVEAITGMVTVGTETADVRALYYFPTAGVLLAYAILSATPNVSQIYKVDQYDLSFSLYGNPQVATQPIRPFFGSLVNGENWKYWAVNDNQLANNVTLYTYDLTGVLTGTGSLNKFKNPPNNPPNVKNDTRMHIYHSLGAPIYFNAPDDSVYYLILGVSQSTDTLPVVSPSLQNSDFPGTTRDGLLWIFDRSTTSWIGMWSDLCNPPSIVGPSSTPNITCTESTDPYINNNLAFPPMSYDSQCTLTTPIWAWTQYNETSNYKDCSQNNRKEIIQRTWKAKSWVNSTVYTYNQNINVTKLGVSDHDYQSQLNNLTLSCHNSTAIGFAPPGNGDLFELVEFPCGDSVLYQNDTVTKTCPYNITINRVWWFNDFCDGIVYYPTQQLTVRDTGVPFINVSDSITKWNETVPVYTGYPTYYDDCSATNMLIVTYVDNRTFNFCTEPDEIERTWTVVDECGLSNSIKQKLTVNIPQVYFPTDLPVECGNDTTPASMGKAYSDDPNFNATYTDSEFYYQPCYRNLFKIITRNWVVNDYCGQRTGIQTITVRDTLPPVLTVQADQTLECDLIPDNNKPNLPPSSLLINATAYDACIGQVNVTLSESRPYQSQVQTGNLPKCQNNVLNARITNRVWTATDTCTNDVSVTQVITFKDTKAPYYINPPRTDITSILLPEVSICLLTSVDEKVGNLDFNVTFSDNCDPTKGQKTNFPGDINKPICNRVVYEWLLNDWCNNTDLQNITVDILIPQGNHASYLRAGSFTLLLLWLFYILSNSN